MNSSMIKNLINDPTAILVSGGLDSAILLADMVNHKFPKIWPVFVQCGLYWEKTELEYLRRFINAIKAPNLAELIILDVPVGDLYKDHWSLTGIDVPDVKSPDEAVFLPGRNVLLTAKALLWCNLNQVKSLSLAVLESNPFPDATDSFFLTMEQAINESVSGNVKLLRPYAGMHKTDVLKIGRNAPLEHTFSCIYPINGMHCGKCNKCAERKNGFSQASMKDPTSYS